MISFKGIGTYHQLLGCMSAMLVLWHKRIFNQFHCLVVPRDWLQPNINNYELKAEGKTPCIRPEIRFSK